jgi:putative addiction module CopG family antidote
MSIHLSKDLERFIHDAVRAGPYNSEDDAIRDALTRLEKTLPKPAHIRQSCQTHQSRAAEG